MLNVSSDNSLILKHIRTNYNTDLKSILYMKINIRLDSFINMLKLRKIYIAIKVI